MNRLGIIVLALLISSSLFTSVSSKVSAAYLRGGDDIDLSTNEKVENPYLFGGNITSNATVSGDLVTAGGNITIRGNTTGSINAAGGNIVIDATVGNSIRVAGGDIRISGRIAKDVVAAGGSIIIEKNASIGGDLIFTGGTLRVEGPIAGKVVMNGGNVILKSTIGGDASGEIGTLQIQEGAEIGGNLTYASTQRALISDAAIIRGEQTYRPSNRSEDENELTRLFAAGTFFKLVTDILFSLLLIYLFPGVLKRVSATARSKPLKSSVVGGAFLLLTPLTAILLLLVIWLGLSVFLIYFLFLILALMVGKILIGWIVLDWWAKRNKNVYKLDWKAGVVGPILLTILFLIPIIGWLAIATIYLISLGALFLTSLKLRDVSAK